MRDDKVVGQGNGQSGRAWDKFVTDSVVGVAVERVQALREQYIKQCPSILGEDYSYVGLGGGEFSGASGSGDESNGDNNMDKMEYETQLGLLDARTVAQLSPIICNMQSIMCRTFAFRS